jgi:hypothetical protein
MDEWEWDMNGDNSENLCNYFSYRSYLAKFRVPEELGIHAYIAGGDGTDNDEWVNLDGMVNYRRSMSLIGAARLIVGLHQYRNRTGTWPKTLDALAPLFIQQVPGDSITNGGRYVYSLSDGQPELTSISPLLEPNLVQSWTGGPV